MFTTIGSMECMFLCVHFPFHFYGPGKAKQNDESESIIKHPSGRIKVWTCTEQTTHNQENTDMRSTNIATQPEK